LDYSSDNININNSIKLIGFDGASNIEEVAGRRMSIRGNPSYTVPQNLCWIDLTRPLATLPWKPQAEYV